MKQILGLKPKVEHEVVLDESECTTEDLRNSQMDGSKVYSMSEESGVFTNDGVVKNLAFDNPSDILNNICHDQYINF